MSGLYLHTSNRLEALAAALTEVLAQPLASPLTSETVAVQSKGMERWLCLQLAGQRGIWANYRFPFPNALIRELIASVLDNTEENPLLQPELLAWRLYALLPDLLDSPAFVPLAPYLAAAPDDPLRRWQLCRQLADCFDQYLVYRHDLIRTWERGNLAGLGPHEAWQAELWHLLAPAKSAPHRARLVEACVAHIAKGPLLAGCRLPERISLFGVTTLPPLHLEILAAVAPFTDVHLFLLNPCRSYWFELKTPLEEARTLRQAEAQGIEAEELWLASGHPLLASLGKSGRDLFRRLFDCELTSREYFVPAEGTTLLARMQNDILDGESWPPTERQPLAADDRSLSLHACYGPLREVEALHDLLLTAFRELDDLAPREVLVMAPDIEVYAPLIDAVFGVEVEGKRLIPYAISDRGPSAASPLQQAFVRLCSIPDGRRGAAELLDLLELAPVARRFALSNDELETVRDWVETLHIHWGLDSRDRAASGAPSEERFTWRAGLDRLLLGLALPSGEQLFDGHLPADGASASSALLGRLCDFIARLTTWCDDCQQSQPLTAWVGRMQQLFDDFLDSGDEPQRLLALHRACATLAQEARQTGLAEAVPFSVVRARLEALLGERSTHGFLSGPVTFCTLQPMRSVPFRVVALIGMNDGDFPRQGRSSGFDLMSRERRLCDPQRRDEDRYLFLEALLSARERLIVTWQGRDSRDASSRPPAVVVGELIDAVCASVVTDDVKVLRESLVIRHPLQPFSPVGFRSDFPVSGASPQWFAAVQASRHRLAAEPAFCPTSLSMPTDFPTSIPFADLERFWRQPAEYFLKRRLRLRLVEADEGVVEREPFALDGLSNYQLGQGLIKALLDGATAADCFAFAQSGGALPAGPMGEGAWRNLSGEAHGFAAILLPLLPVGEPSPVTLELDGRQLVGEVPSPGMQGRLVWRFAKLKAKDRLSAWLRHLCACASALSEPTLLVGRDDTLRYAALDAVTAQQYLKVLLTNYLVGNCRPLPFFPESALAFATQLHKGKGREEALAAAAKVWFSGEYTRGEDNDRHYRLCFGSDPLDSVFEELAQAIWGPLLTVEKVE